MGSGDSVQRDSDEEERASGKGREESGAGRVSLSLHESLGAIKNTGNVLSAQNSNYRVLPELLRKHVFRSFAKCMSEWVLVDGSSLCDRFISLGLRRSGSISGDRGRALKYYDCAEKN